MRFALFAVLVLALPTPTCAQGVLGDDGVYVLAEVAPAPVGGMAAIADALVYPDAALGARAEGTVVLTFIVEPDGALREAAVARAPHPLLGEAALAAVGRVAFSPGVVGDSAVATRMSLPVRFVLPEAEPSWEDQPAAPVGGWNRVLGAVDWPARWRESGAEASFNLVVDVDAEGHVTNARIFGLQSTGGRVTTETRVVPAEDAAGLANDLRREADEATAALRERLLDAIRTARFTPEIRDGEAVASRADVMLTTTPGATPTD